MRPVQAGLLADRVRQTSTNIRLGLTFRRLDPDEAGVSATFSDGTEDGALLIVSRDLARAAPAGDIAPSPLAACATGTARHPCCRPAPMRSRRGLPRVLRALTRPPCWPPCPGRRNGWTGRRF